MPTHVHSPPGGGVHAEPYTGGALGHAAASGPASIDASGTSIGGFVMIRSSLAQPAASTPPATVTTKAARARFLRFMAHS